MRQVLKVFVYVTVFILIGVSMFASFRHYRGDQLLSVQTGSMTPAFYPGDAVATRKASLSELNVGDIVAYRNPNDRQVTVSHRLIGVNYRTGKLITAGDALDLQDVPFPANLVVGKVYKIVPNAGYILDWLHEPIGLIALVYIPAAFILVSEAKRLSKQYARPYYQNYKYSLKLR
jgi:signal peptidase I